MDMVDTYNLNGSRGLEKKKQGNGTEAMSEEMVLENFQNW